MITDLLRRDVSIVSRVDSSDVDDYGNAVQVETRTEVKGELQQIVRGLGEAEDAVGVENLLLVLPAGTTLDSNDRIVVDSVSYEVVSPPSHVCNARTGQEHHVEVTLGKAG